MCSRGVDRKSWLEIEEAWLGLRAQGPALMPYFRQAYPRFRNAAGRAALVFAAAKHDPVEVALRQQCAASTRIAACGGLRISIERTTTWEGKTRLAQVDVRFRPKRNLSTASPQSGRTQIGLCTRLSSQ
jgi:hypothetical protein